MDSPRGVKFSVNDVFKSEESVTTKKGDGRNHQKPHALNNVSEEKGTGFF